MINNDKTTIKTIAAYYLYFKFNVELEDIFEEIDSLADRLILDKNNDKNTFILFVDDNFTREEKLSNYIYIKSKPPENETIVVRTTLEEIEDFIENHKRKKNTDNIIDLISNILKGRKYTQYTSNHS